MLITTDSHPNILEAMHCIEDDSGNQLKIPVKDVPARWDTFLDRIEKVLSQLSRTERDELADPLPSHVKPDAYLDSQFYSFCNGEYEERGRIANRSEDYCLTCEFLDDFFDDWSLTTDKGGDGIMNTCRRRQIEFLQMVERESGTGLTPEQQIRMDRLRLSLTA